MSEFSFDKITDRTGTLSYKWQVDSTELPMWVADMDFETAPAVKAAIVKRAEHGIFGYTDTPKEYFEALSSYFERRHGFAIPTEWLIYSNGVVAAISSLVRRFSHPAESVLIMAPVYNIFYNSILNNGRNVLSCELTYEGGEYSLDFDKLEEMLARPLATLMILCNPHNPVGKVWAKEELIKIGELCKRHNVTVISDEIHCDFVKPGLAYTPFASASDTCADISVSCVSASKTFNIAGLQSAAVFAKNPLIRYRAFRGINNDEVGEPNAFSMQACIAAYTECDGWVDGLIDYVFENKRLACEYINERIEGLRVKNSDATYLLWIDISALGIGSCEFCQKIRELTGLYITAGVEYGEAGDGFVRMNLATQRERVKDGLKRLEKGVMLLRG